MTDITEEQAETCGHKYKEVECGLDKGHEGVHILLSEADMPVHKWNDNGETALPGMRGVFPCDHDDGKAIRQNTMNLAIADARSKLPKGVVFEVLAHEYPKEDGRMIGLFSDRRYISRREMAELWGIFWRCVPKQPAGFEYLEIPATPLMQLDVDEGETTLLGGSVLLARIEA